MKIDLRLLVTVAALGAVGYFGWKLFKTWQTNQAIARLNTVSSANAAAIPSGNVTVANF
jgi:predicted negative regulator of RcsB-dependent stress response